MKHSPMMMSRAPGGKREPRPAVCDSCTHTHGLQSSKDVPILRDVRHVRSHVSGQDGFSSCVGFLQKLFTKVSASSQMGCE